MLNFKVMYYQLYDVVQIVFLVDDLKDCGAEVTPVWVPISGG